ncbi:HesA/MoeB/ThiF family protein [Frigoriflavimonas asaccharolytica]|uniref:Molybdopterin-synthase adenylyltransferase n=1 Tax=Frigoriflavimonas asaccharolytica TaxID=2735899 RepID=A0A8J8G4M3_9FLAO|nr:HesA/MoeB/ThiF family protein [Frigoriflavimonas asaccharolytica]NRS91211.1 adenylyltransferase/sulfurtransferase [Frigoriflavimonas asaccharolytica]
MEHSKRYSRQIVLPEIGSDGQQKLQNAKVLIIGVGGLGCPVLQILAASGVGNLGIVDGDIVDESNLHRQILFNINDCGKLKVDVAIDAILKMNSEIKMDIYSEFINESNIFEIAKNYDILVDCTDSIETRYLINDIAVYLNKPMIYASIHKFEAQLSVFNYKNGATYRCLFPEKESETIPNCVTTGVLGVLPNTLGMLQATEVLKILLGIGSVFSEKLLLYNSLEMSFNEIEFTKNKEQFEIGFENGKQLIQNKKQNLELNKIDFLEKCLDENFKIIDLREDHELPKLNYNSVINIPFSEIEKHQNEFEKIQKIVLFCQSGIRSKKALELFINKGFTNVYHLQNGIQSLHLEN